MDPAAVRARLAGVRDRIARAADRAGRDPSSVRLVAVSKTFSAEFIQAAAANGQVDFGENKVQEALGKIEQTARLSLRWHLVGHLQSNKARKAAQAFDVIHSIDSLDLLRRVDAAAADAGRRVHALVQVDLGREPTKHGAALEDVAALFSHAAQLHAVRLVGLMTLPPPVDDQEGARPFFHQLRDLRDRLIAGGIPSAMLTELSMGMSHDFEVAIEEGATLVRIGTAIFGSRSYV